MKLRTALLVFLLTFFAALTSLAKECPETKVSNTSKIPWNLDDEKSLRFNKKRCAQIWPDAPCLKWFNKVGKKNYSAVCTYER